MGKMRVAGAIVASLLLGAGSMLVALPAEAKDPPACQAISFRPLVPGGMDGEMEAGMSQGRKVVIMATVRGGQAENYYMLLNGSRPDGEASIAPGSEACLKSKHVVVPVKTQGESCTGDRFRVVIYRSGATKTAMLFGLHGDEWHFCNAAKM